MSSNNVKKDIANPTEEEYPENLTMDFRKLTTRALLNYISHHGIGGISKDFSQPKLANVVARHFMSWKLNESAAIESFCSNIGFSWNGRYLGHLSAGMSPRGFGEKYSAPKQTVSHSHSKKRRRPPTATGPASHSSKKHRVKSQDPARRGEQVAAKITSSDENGAWILARVVEYNLSKNSYKVQDEDDVSKVMELKASDVLRLNDSTGHFMKGDKVLAMFPETTSFYRGIVNRSSSTDEHKNKTIVVKFEDDEDENGRTPSRHIPMRYVLRVPTPAAQPSNSPVGKIGDPPVQIDAQPLQTGANHHLVIPPNKEDFQGNNQFSRDLSGEYSQEKNIHALSVSQAPASSAHMRQYSFPAPTSKAHSKPRNILPQVQHGGHVVTIGGTNFHTSARNTHQPSLERHTIPPKINTTGKQPGEITYSDMITQALNQLPETRGNFKEICHIIEKQFTKQLNWKLESSAMRKTPVWKSSVRKILFSNKNFAHADGCEKNVFTFTRLTSQGKK